MDSDIPTTSTTFNTWIRVASEHLDRVGELAQQTTKVQTAALEQGREYLAYHLRLAADWQNWAMDTGRKIAGQVFTGM